MHYVRAEGSRLWWGTPEDGPVWDFLGGYGSTFFGHNHLGPIAILEAPLVRVEEEYLQEAHGAAFAAYCRRTPRWLFRLGPER